MTLVFIDLLKVLATGLITNSHLANVWPISAVASGGMLGNVLFFAISGYCLTMKNPGVSGNDVNIRRGGIRFLLWYGKRIRRIYISVWFIEIITWILAGRLPSFGEVIKYFVFPTRYHFVASIMILYIVFYLVQYIMGRWHVSLHVIAIVYTVAVLLFYLILYDKSYAHVDVVEEPFIRCLFFGAMLIGVYFRRVPDQKCQKKRIIINTALMLFFTALYFGTKIILSHSDRTFMYNMQIVTWITILIALYFIFNWARVLEPLLVARLPVWMKKVLHFVATLTLQIYLVQFMVIGRFESLMFPLDLVVIIVGILAAATVLYLADKAIQHVITERKC